MGRLVISLVSMVILITVLGGWLIAGCGQPEPVAPTEKEPSAVPELAPPKEPAPATEVPAEKYYLTSNPVETSMPIYGGIIKFGQQIPRSFDGHQKMAYGPLVTLPTFNPLVS